MEITVKRNERLRVYDNTDGTKTVTITKVESKLKDLNPGEVFRIGDNDFIVLEQDVENGVTCVISKWLMAENVRFGNNNDYCNSNLKTVMETDILPIIEREVGAENICVHTVSLRSVDMQHGTRTLRCRIRPITFDEARKYNNLLVSEELDDWWWTCTPWSTEERGWGRSITVVSPSGNFNNFNCDYCTGVRPFCILNSNIFVSKGE